MADQVEQVTTSLASMQSISTAVPCAAASDNSVHSYAAATSASEARKPALTTNKKVRNLVIDSGAIIKGTNLAVLAEVIVLWSVNDWKCDENLTIGAFFSVVSELLDRAGCAG